jgi:hypothetical protein
MNIVYQLQLLTVEELWLYPQKNVHVYSRWSIPIISYSIYLFYLSWWECWHHFLCILTIVSCLFHITMILKAHVFGYKLLDLNG